METLRHISAAEARLHERVEAPLLGTSRAFRVWVAVLVAVIAWGAVAYYMQARDGLYVTGMRDRIMWGLYIALFVFFIGASMAGTFVSALLRLTSASWRAPIIRGAEMMTVAALITAGLFVLFDIGRPDRLHHFFLFGRWESPLIWDMYGLATYMAGSMLYLYLAMIPDLAFVSDRLGDGFGTIRRSYYRVLSVAWIDGEGQRAILHRAIVVMTIAIVPVAVMMHTVTSWIFGMTLREPWNSSMFGIFFVAGAIYSGIGLIVILMAVMRRVYRLEEFITDRHFLYLGYMLAAFAVIMVFFNVSEFVTLGYKLSADATFNLNQMISGDLAPVFWIYIWAGLVLPILVILVPYTRNLKGILLAAVAANIGMFLERYFIVVGGLRVPLNPYEPATYSPSWVEWSLMAAGIAVFLLLLTVLLKFLPIVAVWEMHEEAFANGHVAVQDDRPLSPEPGATPEARPETNQGSAPGVAP